MFGKNANFSDETVDGVTVTVNANEYSTDLFSQSFAADVVILETKTLAEYLQIRQCFGVEGEIYLLIILLCIKEIHFFFSRNREYLAFITEEAYCRTVVDCDT